VEGGLTGEEHPTAGTGEVLGLLARADAVYAAEGVVEDRDLDEAGYRGGDDLRGEHGPWRDLHVVSELEVAYEAEGLGHCDVAECLEAAVSVSTTNIVRESEAGLTS